MATRKRKGSEAQEEKKEKKAKEHLRCGFCSHIIHNVQLAHWDPETATPYCILACQQRRSVKCSYCNDCLDPFDKDTVADDNVAIKDGMQHRGPTKYYCGEGCHRADKMLRCAECDKELVEPDEYHDRVKGVSLCEGECTKKFTERLEKRALAKGTVHESPLDKD